MLKKKFKLRRKASLTSFVARQQPQSIFDLMLSNEQRLKLTNWFENLKQSDNLGLFLIGPPGSGKTSVIKVFAEQFGYTVKEFNALDCRNKKVVDSTILKMIENVPIDSQLFDKKKYLIVIDEMECMADKNSLNTIIKLINQKKRSPQQPNVTIPLVFISDETTEKKVNELKKHCVEVHFYRPSPSSLIKLAERIFCKEHCVMEENKRQEILELVAQLADGDYRRLINLIEFVISQNTPDSVKVITLESVASSAELFKEKYRDYDIYQNTVNLFTSQSIADVVRIYENDKSLLPMMIHENYSYLIGQKYNKKKEQLKYSLKTIDYITQGDLIDKVMYNTQSWHYYSIHSLMSCYLPAYTAWFLPKRPNIKFTTTLGKHSLQSSNKKKFLSVLSSIGSGKMYDTTDLFYLSNIVRFHATNAQGNIETVKQLMRSYNLSFDTIDRIIRFSKLGEDDSYGIKTKNLLKRQLQNFNKS